MGKLADSPLDPTARAVADRLHGASKKEMVRSAAPALTKMVKHRFREGTWDNTQSEDGKAFLADKMVALDKSKAELCYLLCRSLDARRVVEAGTSYGVSTIYLAAAVRDNVAGTGETAVVYGTEHEPGKVAQAEQNLTDAGLLGYTQILSGDLRETLPDVDGPIDFMLVDIWIPMALPALKAVEPKLRRGALVLCDNVISGAKEYADYLTYVRDPHGPFQSVTIPGQGGVEVSMKR